MISSYIGLIILIVALCFGAYYVDVLRLRRLIKDYNKRHPDSPCDPKKSTPWSMNKQLIDWQIEMFAKKSDGKSYYESWSNNWEVFNDEDKTD